MRPHRRQFVVGSKPFRAYDDWQSHQLDASTWVSYCADLRAAWTSDADGIQWMLLGLAVETLESQADPMIEIARTASADVPNLYASWAGRWVLVGCSEIHMDATGLLGCFYGITSEKQTWVSSSSVLLAQILSPNASPVVFPEVLRYTVGISWFPPPYSRFVGVYRLLPSQVIELKEGSIRSRAIIPPIDPSLGYDKTVELLNNSLVTALKRLPIGKGKLWVGLSAGIDSRLVFALAHCAGIDIIPFTRLSARMPIADRLLPPKLAQELGYNHIFLQGHKSNSDDRKRLVAEHTGGHVSIGDAEPFMQSVRDSLEGISVGGWCFEVGKAFWRNELPDTLDDLGICAQQIAQLLREPLNSIMMVRMGDWLEWVKKNPQENLDWRDQFFIEQRLAGWQSSKEQLYDLTKTERIPIINAARNYALMFGLEESCRVDSLHQVDLISRAVPELGKYPYNPPNHYFGTLVAIKAIAIKFFKNPLSFYKKVVNKLQRK
ncbi:hypothetical protein I8751_23445 [Nostocaceae cyanobacterium CENA357]|uniref:Asparagine synthetase domain-containing protein n=1 Tax=Atlanticothrix silvestris CENA357 TaxID=1725252 RepID=A0A8J7HGK7_9CYAN|nr:hypothetical protein [Atlanticothrix silvestris CENA357]